ncbi:MAG: hypothetical protein ABJC05_10720 [Pyrinomonadaceae bacterium]
MIRAFICAFAVIIISIAGVAQTPRASSAASAAGAQAQSGDPAITGTRVYGKVSEVNGPAGQMTVKTDAGSVVTVKLSEKTTYERMPPGETDRTKAVAITLTDISIGDGLYARGRVSEDRKSVPAQQVVIVSQSDIAKKQDKERAEWRQRGILGTISALNPAAKEITITFRSMMGPQPVIIPVTDKIKMLRYAPDSIRFSDAKPSTLAELKVGDQLRALGEKSADGTHFAAEKVVTGSFRTIGGVVTAIDVATGEVKINDLQTKRPLTVVIKQDAVLRRFPQDMGMMMGMGGGAGRGPGGPGAAGAPGANGARGNPSGQPGGRAQGASAGAGTGPGNGPRAGGGGMNIQAMLEQLPTISLADLKVGDTIIVSSTTGADPSRLTAITLVSGADTLLNLLAARQQQGGQPAGANLGGGGGGGGAGIGFFGGIGP